MNENPKAVDYDPSFGYPQTLLGFNDDAFSKSKVKKKQVRQNRVAEVHSDTVFAAAQFRKQKKHGCK